MSQLGNETSFGGFFRGKHVLVTGAAGVKGTWLCLALLAAGATVSGLDVKQPDPRSNFVMSGLRRRIRLRQVDVTDFEAMRRLLDEHDALFHLAALVLVHDCEARPFETYRTNTFGTVAVLEAFRMSSRAKYGVFVTTDKVYKAKSEPWLEEDNLFATGSYAISKACAEEAIADYRSRLEVKGKRFGIGRAGNVMIGGDFYTSSQTGGAGRIVPDCFEALIAGRAPTIFSPSYTRPYTYGLDVVRGYMSLMSQLDQDDVHGEPFNFGPQDQNGIPNGLLASQICEEWGQGITPQIGSLRSEPFATQALSWEKARQRLGWCPAYTLSQGIKDTVEWYRAWNKAAEKGRVDGALKELTERLLLRHHRVAALAGASWASEWQAQEADYDDFDSTGLSVHVCPEHMTS